MVFPVIQFLFPWEEDDLADLIRIPIYNKSATTFGDFYLKYNKTDGENGYYGSSSSVAQGTPVTPTYWDGINGNVDMEVPAGKTWYVVLVVRGDSSPSCAFDVWESSTADTASGTQKFESNGTVALNNWLTTSVMSFAAGKFVTVEATTASEQVQVDFAGVIEVDA